ncbi:hypothetical protein FRC03_004871 [Tulasnella sp. 419]|nr:hypothetical protein FRC03_004871 [Tulasnella sp. 419]
MLFTTAFRSDPIKGIKSPLFPPQRPFVLVESELEKGAGEGEVVVLALYPISIPRVCGSPLKVVNYT